MRIGNFSGLAFVGKNFTSLRSAFQIVGYDGEWEIPAMAAWGQEWLTGTHGKLSQALTDQQWRDLLPLLIAMDCFGGITPPEGRYTDLVIGALKFPALVTQLERCRTMLEARNDEGSERYWFDRVTGLFGQRPRTNELDGELSDIIDRIPARVNRQWWVSRELQKTGDGLFEGPFATEFELGILATLIAFEGAVEVCAYAQACDTNSLPGIPPREAASCTLMLPTGMIIRVMNAPAVERPKGDPRPTTESSAAYWLSTYPPSPDGRIVLMAGGTHGYRVTGDFERVVHQTYPQAEVYCSSRSLDEADQWRLRVNALGEVFALLNKAADELAEHN